VQRSWRRPGSRQGQELGSISRAKAAAKAAGQKYLKEQRRKDGAGGKPQEGKGKGDRKGKGKGKGDRKGQGNGKGDRKGKGKGKDQADKAFAALVSDDQPRASAAVAGGSRFPRKSIGLDSWAKVWLTHQKAEGSGFGDELILVQGAGKCRREVGQKGVPQVFVPLKKGGENIDLFPEGFLYERGCTIVRGNEHYLETPRGRRVTIQVWGSLPYIAKDELQRILADLPEIIVPGRSGNQAREPTAARVCRAECTTAQMKGHLQYL